MTKKITWGIVATVAVATVVGFFLQGTSRDSRLGVFNSEIRACTAEAKLCPDGSAVGRTGPNCEFAACPSATPAHDYKNATYIIEGLLVTLSNGISEIPAAPGSASKVVTRYFGNNAKEDLNNDGIPDLAFLITQSSGGSGTFYYAVAAIQNASGDYTGTAGTLLGDRIAPQTTEIRSGQVIVNYAVRAPGESFIISPSVGKSIWLKLDPATMQFGEVVQNFEGEADPARMTLGMKTWVWVRTVYSDGKVSTPNKGGAFTATFGDDGKFSAATDCNRVGGGYAATKSTITFSNMFATKMYCEGSQESEFVAMLGEVSGYHFTAKGELILDLKMDSGVMIFR